MAAARPARSASARVVSLSWSPSGKADAPELPRIEGGEHVALVLRRVGTAREQQAAVALDDACVVAGREPLGAGAPREREQLGEAEAAVAARARVRRLPARIAAHERGDDGAAEFLPQIQRHVRDAEPVTRLARRNHALGRAAGALGVGAVRVEPEPQRHADGVRQRAQEGHRAVDAAAHCHGHASGRRLGPEDRPESVRERVHGQRLAADRSRLEERQADEVAV